VARATRPCRWATRPAARQRTFKSLRAFAETTMSLKWIAQRLRMGSWTYVSNLLNENAARKKSINSEDRHLHVIDRPTPAFSGQAFLTGARSKVN